LQTWLQNQGHPFVRVSYPDLIPLSDMGMELSFPIEEVLPAENCLLHFSGLRYFSEAKLCDLLLISDKKEVNVNELPRLMENILREYHQRGFLFASVQLDSLVLNNHLVAYINIQEGKPFKPENYYIEGNKYTKEKTLIKLSGLNELKVVTPQAIETAQKNILSKSYIQSCQIEPLDPTSILIKIEEGKMTYLEGLMGLNNRNEKTELTGYLNLKFMNLWGSDRSIALNWRQNPYSSNLEFAYHESGPINIPLSGDLALSRMVQDSTWIKSSVQTDIYSYHAKQKYGIELASETISPGSRRPILVEKSSANSIGAFWQLDSRNQIFNPTRGIEIDIIYKLKYLTSERNWINSLETHYIQYLNISRRFSASMGFHLCSLDDSTSTDYLWYSMGGFNSLRGYRENEFSSWRLAWSNLELHYLINPDAMLYCFFDYGIYARTQNSIDAKLFAPGLGLRVRTRLGILRMEYGLGYREDGFPSLASGMVHAGIETSF
ncbi:MAG TPA: BamA/TamA family outer membrane protein, partial [Candidatus Syntrophosphaera thermopropionivorans]|nr:BamA/TamA family outer membrane protein [Candidatus Syntrophosphaera thermopropionivorans]